MRSGVFFLLFLVAAGAAFLPPLHAEDGFSASGRLTLWGVYALDPDSVGEDPSLIGKLEIDARKSDWRLHSWLEGGWDGTVRSPRRDHSLLKSFDEVYQDNTPYLEFKELFVERTLAGVDLRVGIQRFAWGRLDEYPVNDLFNPWDYTRFIIRPIEERKIGVPSVSAMVSGTQWSYQAVWVPWMVPYRLPKPNERWSLIPAGTALSETPDADILAREPDLPAYTLENGSAGFRVQRMGDEIEWAVNIFHGFDPRPTFKTTSLSVTRSGEGKILIDPGFVPSFHKITSVGADAAMVKGDWSLRAEAAYAFGKTFNVRRELWGYPENADLSETEDLDPGTVALNPVEVERDALDYGIAADYRVAEDWMLTMQAQQTAIVDRPGSLYDGSIETILWANLRTFWMNQKIETNVNLAYNPEHGASMIRPGVKYIFSDSWKAGVTGVLLNGPPQSIFGRYSQNDQVEMTLTFSW